jgi:hypothetical protein
MATLYITEYADIHIGQAGRVGQIPLEPPLAEQTVAIGGSSTQSAAFNAATRMVRLHSDAVCSVAFGTNPVAAATNARMGANQTEYKSVPANQSFKVAAITNT